VPKGSFVGGRSRPNARVCNAPTAFYRYFYAHVTRALPALCLHDAFFHPRCQLCLDHDLVNNSTSERLATRPCPPLSLISGPAVSACLPFIPSLFILPLSWSPRICFLFPSFLHLSFCNLLSLPSPPFHLQLQSPGRSTWPSHDISQSPFDSADATFLGAHEPPPAPARYKHIAISRLVERCRLNPLCLPPILDVQTSLRVCPLLCTVLVTCPHHETTNGSS